MENKLVMSGVCVILTWRQLVFLYVLLCAVMGTAIGGQGVSVTTSLGIVRGERYNTLGLRRFLGIPFAQPPILKNRFRPAQPPIAWGELNATSYGKPCLQRTTWWVPYASNETSEVPDSTTDSLKCRIDFV